MKKILALALALIMSLICFSSVSFAAEAQTADHLTEVPEGYTGIYTKDDLDNIKLNTAGKYILMNNITFDDSDYIKGGSFYNSGRGWDPIGAASPYFTGVFDGNNYYIKNLYINDIDCAVGEIGLFSRISAATIKNLKLKDVDITGYDTYDTTGGISGTIYNSNVTNCSVSGKITGASSTGGICGKSSGRSKIQYCSSSAEVTSPYNAGGITGVQSPSSEARNSVNYIEYCYNSGTVVSEKGSAGGISAQSMSRYYWSSSSLSGTSSSYNYSQITNSYNCGTVKGYTEAGGICGEFTGDDTCRSSAKYCINIGNVSSEKDYGALFGYVEDSSATSCYYLDESVSAPTCNIFTSKSDDQLKKQSTFTDYDFETIWTMDGREDYPYPELRDTALYFPGEDPDHEHSYISTVTTPATHLTDGVMTFTCECGDTYTEKIEKISDHPYEAVVTAPTCTSKGYTTYTCECGESFNDSYVDATGHNYIDGVCNACGELEIVTSGNCGDNVTWTYYATGLLAITGEGAMYDFPLSSQPWYNYKQDISEIIIGEKVTTIGASAFYQFPKITEMFIPKSITGIGEHAFSNCDNLTSFTVDENNTCYSNDEFGILFNKDKTNLIKYPMNNEISEYTIPDSVITIEDDAFFDCDNIKVVTLGQKVETIGESAFNHCGNLQSIAISDSVTSIGTYAFYNCYNLTSVKIPDSIKTISKGAFVYCYALKHVTMGKNVETIEESAFHSCSALESITIPDSAKSIGDKAFIYCYKLKDVYYEGTEELWNEIAVGTDNAFLTGATIHYNSCLINDNYIHTCTSRITTQPTHLKEGVRTYTCPCGYSYTETITKLTTHTYTSQITTQPTHKDEGVKTFTCACGDTYTETVAKIPHSYNQSVTAPTCTAQGYTTYTCACGDSYVDNYTDKLGHEYTSAITTEPTHLKEGVKTFTCKCGDTYTEVLAKLTEHSYTSEVTKEATHLAEGETTYTCACGYSYTETIAKLTGHIYNKTVTEPTCTSKGYTTYTCACGYSYVGDYVGNKAHTYTSVVTTPSTHLAEGKRTYTCTACGHSYSAAIAAIKEHTYYVVNVVEPTCESEGYTVYMCECGESYNGNKTAATGHNYNGDTCTDCGESKSSNCSCLCHKSGFLGFIWKILRFFYKLFGINKICDCGVSHY